MKNKIQKNNEKNIDQITRSRSIRSRWAVRLLVLLVMITTILASFVVPASAAENPFVGAARVHIDNFSYIESKNPITGSLNGRLDNDFVSGSVIAGLPNVSVTVSNGRLVVDFPSDGVNLLFRMSFTYIRPDQFPFESCNLPITTNTGDVIPANANIVQYCIDNGLVGSSGYLPFDSNDIEIYYAFNDDDEWEAAGKKVIFTIRDGYYSTEVEGGIQSVFDLIGSWLSNTFTTLGGVFFDNGSLTVLGALAIGSLGVSVILLLIKVISNFIRFRG